MTTVPQQRFLSHEECRALYERIASFIDTGQVTLDLQSTWTGTTRFTSNTIRTSRDVTNNDLLLRRSINGAAQGVLGNQIDDVSLRAMVRRLEHFIDFLPESADERMRPRLAERSSIDRMLTALGYTREQAAREFHVAEILANTPEPMTSPTIFFDTTYAMDPGKRAAAIEQLVTPSKQAGMLAAGQIEVVATGHAFDNTADLNLYYPNTMASYSMTVRSPDGTASGWAGVNWFDWNRVDATHLAQTALEKCLRSKNPVRVEPGRYEVILEPQAVWDLCWPPLATLDGLLDKPHTRVIDERLSIRQDPLDPECGSMPFEYSRLGNVLLVYHPATWVDRGGMVQTPYLREDGIRRLHQNTGLPLSGSHRVSAPANQQTSMEEMIATSKRAILVTRLPDTVLIDKPSYMFAGYTRDGTWLIENGKITKPIKNMKFVESPLLVLNRVEQIGAPQRVLSLNQGFPSALIPALKVRDFSFTALTDAI